MSKLIARLSYANVVATLALFIALGGGAYAVSLKRDSVKSRHIKNDTIRTKDIQQGTIRQGDIVENGVRGKQVFEQSLDVSEFADLDRNATVVSCNPSSLAYVECIDVSLNGRQRGRAMVVASVGFEASGGPASGSCDLTVDGVNVETPITVGDAQSSNTSINATKPLTLSTVSSDLSAREHTFGLSCREESGNAIFHDPQISAFFIGQR